ERRQRDDRDLRARPETATEGEPERDEVEPGDPRVEAEDDEEDDEREDELGAVEAVRARRLPGEVRRPEPEEKRCEHRAPLVEDAKADAPDEHRRGRPEHDDDDADRPDPQPEAGDERRGEELLLRAPVALAGEEDGERPVEDAARQEPDDGLVGVERSLRQEHRPDAQRGAAEHAGDDDGARRHAGLRASRDRARLARRLAPAAHSTKSAGRLAYRNRG